MRRRVSIQRPPLSHVTLAMLVAAVVWLRWSGASKWNWIDIDVYLRGAAAVLHHESLYDVSTHDLPFTYPPFAAVLFMPLYAMGDAGARLALTALSLVSYASIVAICARRLRMSWPPVLLLGVAGLAIEPMWHNLLLGQINLVLIALVVVDCLVLPARYRGLLIGVAAGIKLVPGVFVVYFALKRDWAAVARSGLGFLASLAVGALFTPGDSWRFWSGGFLQLGRWGAEAVVGGDNQSLPSLLMRLTHNPSPSPVALLGLSAGAMVLAAFAARRQLAAGQDVAALVCVAIGGLLASPISWTHHWLWIVPATMVLAARGQRVLASVVGVIFLIGPMWFTSRRNLHEELYQDWWTASLCAAYIVVGLAMLVTLALPSGRGRRQAAPAPEPSQSGELVAA